MGSEKKNDGKETRTVLIEVPADIYDEFKIDIKVLAEAHIDFLYNLRAKNERIKSKRF